MNFNPISWQNVQLVVVSNTETHQPDDIRHRQRASKQFPLPPVRSLHLIVDCDWPRAKKQCKQNPKTSFVPNRYPDHQCYCQLAASTNRAWPTWTKTQIKTNRIELTEQNENETNLSLLHITYHNSNDATSMQIRMTKKIWQKTSRSSTHRTVRLYQRPVTRTTSRALQATSRATLPMWTQTPM